MTLQETVQAANSGNVDAMVTLGGYYFSLYQKGRNVDVLDAAWSWLTAAAEHDHLPSAGLVVDLCHTMAVPYEKMGNYSEAYRYWKQGYDCAMMIINNSENVSESTRREILGILPEILYGVGYSLFELERVSEAIPYLQMLVDNYGDKNAKVLLGICYTSPNYKNAEKAYPLLRTLEEPDHGIEDRMILYMGWMLLAEIYRIGINGVKNINAAYNCVLKATKIPGGGGESALAELKKYKKRLLGGYTYQED